MTIDNLRLHGYRERFIRESVTPTEGLTDVYEFGVFFGESMCELGNTFIDLGYPVKNFIGFDSFAGIPKETAEPTYDESWDPEKSSYYKAYNASEFFGTGVQETVRNVHGVIGPYVPAGASFALVAGFYDWSLTADLPDVLGLERALWVGIDVDIYSSAKTVLSWLFAHDLVGAGTYFAYDDWSGTPGYRQLLDGESRAHREICEEYGVTFDLVNQSGPDLEQVLFCLRGAV